MTFLCYNQYADSDGFPSGQRERTVNPLSQTTMVRIHPRPPFFLFCGNGGIGRRVRFRSVWGQLHAGSSPVSRTIEERLFGYNRRSSFLHPTRLRNPLSQGTFRLLAHEYQIDKSLGRAICRGFSQFLGEWLPLPAQ